MNVNINDLAGYRASHHEHYAYGTISDYIKKMDNYAKLSARAPKNNNTESSFFNGDKYCIYIF